MRPIAFLLATILSIAMVGCAPEEVGPPSKSDSKTEPKTVSPSFETSSEKVQVNGEEAIKLFSSSDKFSITLPPEFRGCVLTEQEIDRFAKNLGKASASMEAQFRRQGNALRPMGGVVFALNLTPNAVTDGFADNMTLAIKGSEKPQTFEELKATNLAELKNSSPASKFATNDLDFNGTKMAEIRIDGVEPAGGKSIPITRFVYVAQRDAQAFTATYACASSRAIKVGAKFRASALSLKFN